VVRRKIFSSSKASFEHPGFNKCYLDPFSGRSIGGYSNTATVDPVSKTRSYAGSAYAIPVLERPNFHLITEATAHKILFENTGNDVTATGVLVSVKGEIKTFSAKEIILAAGVFNTPKLLELSGIGNEEILKSHSISTVINNPAVGENMQDHLMTGVSFEVADGVMTGDPLMRQEPAALQMAQKLYTEHKAGPFTMGGMQSHAFMPVLEFADAEGRKLQAELLEKYPPKPEDREYYDIVRSIIESPEEPSAAWFMFLAQANLHEAGSSFVGSKLLPENFASLGCAQTHPFSRGTCHISSAEIDAIPLIDPKFFSNPVDLEIMARHVQALEEVRYRKELSPFFKPDGKRNHPDSFKIKDLDEAKKYVLDTALTSYHTCGTASMLPKDKGGVVDNKLRVYGTKNLRVVDASIFPLIPRSNPMATVYAMAEKAADIIKGL
jgi:choline dehydrogenase-like flavoprotein